MISLVMLKWIPFAEETSLEVKTVPLCELKNIPMDMFSLKSLSFVTSALGEPVRLHSKTTKCFDLILRKLLSMIIFLKSYLNL